MPKGLWLMPSWKIHSYWEKKLLDRDYRSIDEWIDNENKEIDVELVKRALMECKYSSTSIGLVYELHRLVEDSLRLYSESYDFGQDLRYKTSTSTASLDRMFIAEAIESLRRHDSWRIEPEYMCITLTYIYHKFGIEGFSASILHMLLDEIAKLKYANPKVIKEYLEEFINEVINSLPRRDMKAEARRILNSVLAKLEEILQDILAEKGLEAKPSSKIRKLTILYDPNSTTKDGKAVVNRIMELAKTRNIEVKLVNVHDLSCSEARDYYQLVRKISEYTKIGLKPRRRPDRKLIDMHECKLVIESGLLVIVEYGDGSKAFYPHYTTMAGSTRYVPLSKLVDQLQY